MNIEQSKVSVIVPIYNSARHLSRCIESIMRQTYQDLEIILINDGSTDETDSICQAFQRTDPRIVYMKQENSGVSEARNAGINVATGKYVTFVDSDDYIEAELVQLLYELVKENKSHIGIAALHSINEAADFTIDIKIDNIDQIMFLCDHYLIFGPTQKLYDLEIIRQNGVCFPKEISYGEDLLFNIDYLYHVQKISFINRVLYHYNRENQNSLSNKKRWDLFSNDMSLNMKLNEWFLDNNLQCYRSKKYIANRVFDTAYNGICLTHEKDSPWNLFELSGYIRRIVNNKDVCLSYEYADVKNYAKWIVDSMKNKRVLLLELAAVIKRLI